MHRCLHIPEILAEIFELLPLCHLRHVLVVCRRFLEPALDAFWGGTWVELELVLEDILPPDLAEMSVENVNACLRYFYFQCSDAVLTTL